MRKSILVGLGFTAWVYLLQSFVYMDWALTKDARFLLAVIGIAAMTVSVAAGAMKASK